MTDPIHVLVVDDDDDVRETLELVLEAEGFQVTSAPNGRVALDQLQKTSPNVILLDLRMPVMSGWQVIEVLRQRGQIQETPIVICTSSPEESPAGFPIIAKPVQLEQMLAAIRSAAASSM